MAAAILTLLRRLRLFHGSQPAVLGRCTMRSRPPFPPMPGFEEDLESDGETDEEQAIISAMKRHQKGVRLKRIQREMEPPGPPERRLTWNAIEQIRYLKQEYPEEWTLQRLAVGFNVSTDVIRRVLKSKFIPPEKRKMKQDTAVSRVLGQISSGSPQQVKLMTAPTDPVQPLLIQSGNKKKLLVGQSSQLLPVPSISDFSQIALRTEMAVQKHTADSLVPLGTTQARAPIVSSVSPRPSESEPSEPPKEDLNVLEEVWDGELLSDYELEELADSKPENKMEVVQKGREFVDSDGNFLYRI